MKIPLQMKIPLRSFLATVAVAVALLVMSGNAEADIVNINALQFRSTGVFGVTGASLITVNGLPPGNIDVNANPLDYVVSVTGQDFDMDGSANDNFTFTLRATPLAGQGNPRSFNQGTDIRDRHSEFTVVDVTGTAANSGDTIIFDGFNGATLIVAGNPDNGIANGTPITGSADINGVTTTITIPAGGGFASPTADVDFAALASSVIFDNSSRNVGTGNVSARAFDLQFSTVAVPEPSSLALLGLSAFGLMARRRRR